MCSDVVVRKRVAVVQRHALQRLRRDHVQATENTCQPLRRHPQGDRSHASALPQLGDGFTALRPGKGDGRTGIQLPLYVLPRRRQTFPLDDVLPKRGIRSRYG